MPLSALAGPPRGYGDARGPLLRDEVFNEAEYAPYLNDGSATISVKIVGRSAIPWGINARDMQGVVYLHPVTSYSKEWVKLNYWKALILEPADQRQLQYLKIGTATDALNYVINKVPPGEYYLVAKLIWRTDNGLENDGVRRKLMIKKITIAIEDASFTLGDAPTDYGIGQDRVGAYLQDRELGDLTPTTLPKK